MTHGEFLELVLQDELAVRQQRLFERRTKAACFRDPKSLEDFDWHFNKTIKRKQIYELATGKFARRTPRLLLIWASRSGQKPYRPESRPRAHQSGSDGLLSQHLR